MDRDKGKGKVIKVVELEEVAVLSPSIVGVVVQVRVERGEELPAV